MPPRKSRSLRSDNVPTPPRPSNGSRKSKTPLRSTPQQNAMTSPQPANGSAESTVAKEKTPEPRPRTDWAKLEENDPGFDGFKIRMRKPTQAAPIPSKKRKRNEPVYTADLSQENPYEELNEDKEEAAKLNTIYSVAPGNYWEDTSRYRKFTVLDQTFEVNDCVFVRPSFEPGREDAFIKFWVARVLEVRAGDEQHVYLRVYWMYRPDDLPHPGRRPYHALHEVIATNEMQIIDATTVEGKADVRYYKEDDTMSQEIECDYLFWRQTYDVLHDAKTPGLSELPKHCIDKAPFNPDVRLVQCDSCTKWLHVPCIEDKVLRQVHKDKGIPYAKKGKRKSLVASAEAVPDPNASFKAEVIFGPGKVNVRITDLRIKDKNEEASWEQDIQCLLCKNTIDAGVNGEAESEQNGAENGEEHGEENRATVAVHTKAEHAVKTESKTEDADVDTPFHKSKKHKNVS